MSAPARKECEVSGPRLRRTAHDSIRDVGTQHVDMTFGGRGHFTCMSRLGEHLPLQHVRAPARVDGQTPYPLRIREGSFDAPANGGARHALRRAKLGTKVPPSEAHRNPGAPWAPLEPSKLSADTLRRREVFALRARHLRTHAVHHVMRMIDSILKPSISMRGSDHPIVRQRPGNSPKRAHEGTPGLGEQREPQHAPGIPHGECSWA